MPSQSGFNLIELIMVMVILGIMAAMSAVPLQQGLMAYETAKQFQVIDAQTYYAVQRMLRRARTAASVTTAGWQDFKFIDIYGNTIEYTYTVTPPTQLSLIESINGVSNTVATNLNNGGFFYYTRTGADSTNAPSTVSAVQVGANYQGLNNVSYWGNYGAKAYLRNLM